jgi:O-acetyl-ADP-ribose deacetylase
MKVEAFAGNILDVPADVLVSTANPWLQMTGGVNLGIIVRSNGELVYEELQAHLRAVGKKVVDPGTVVWPAPARFR